MTLLEPRPQRVGSTRPKDDLVCAPPRKHVSTYLDELGVEFTSPQTLLNSTNEPQGGPDDVLGTFQDDGISREQSSDNRRPRVV